jgi:hypothetical protein
MDRRAKPGNDEKELRRRNYADVPVTCPCGSSLSQR